jgi:hypothetical protein
MTFPGHSYDIHGHSLTSEDFAAARDLVCSAALQQRYLGGGSLHAPHEGRRPDGDGMDSHFGSQLASNRTISAPSNVAFSDPKNVQNR